MRAQVRVRAAALLGGSGVAVNVVSLSVCRPSSRPSASNLNVMTPASSFRRSGGSLGAGDSVSTASSTAVASCSEPSGRNQRSSFRHFRLRVPAAAAPGVSALDVCRTTFSIARAR